MPTPVLDLASPYPARSDLQKADVKNQTLIQQELHNYGNGIWNYQSIACYVRLRRELFAAKAHAEQGPAIDSSLRSTSKEARSDFSPWHLRKLACH